MQLLKQIWESMSTEQFESDDYICNQYRLLNFTSMYRERREQCDDVFETDTIIQPMKCIALTTSLTGKTKTKKTKKMIYSIQ